jgi:hypothetical protein
MKLLNFAAGALLWTLAWQAVSADVVETKDGARLVGKVIEIDGISVLLDTVYAGPLKVKQSEVVGVTTDVPANIRLSSGTVFHGVLVADRSGEVLINGVDGSLHTSIDKIVATWATNAKDPALVALERVWAYEATVDIVGKTGNSEQVSTGLTFRATLAGPLDKLQFYSAYDRQVIQGQKSADQFKAGADYQNSFSGRYSWYLRDELGFDRVKLIEFSNIAAVGFGYDVIKKPKHTLTVRGGFAHRFESYMVDPVAYATLLAADPLDPVTDKRLATKESLDSPGLDFGLSHSLELSNLSIVNRLSFDPAFSNINNFHATQESFLEIPLRNSLWKMRIGVSDDYASKPASKDRLDTTYFTRLLLNWK